MPFIVIEYYIFSITAHDSRENRNYPRTTKKEKPTQHTHPLAHPHSHINLASLKAKSSVEDLMSSKRPNSPSTRPKLHACVLKPHTSYNFFIYSCQENCSFN